jgi:hypothetical protein
MGERMLNNIPVVYNGNRARGRPTKYDPSWHPQMAYKVALLGLTGKEMAGLFDVAESTYELWKTKYPDFSESIKRGGIYADALIAEKLYQKAMGYVYKSQHAIKVKKGRDIEALEIIELHRELPPDVRAAKFWLKNRERRYWGERNTMNSEREAGDNVIEILRQARERLNIGAQGQTQPNE